MVDIIWSDSAKEELRDIKQYISKTSKEYAELFVDRIFEVIENIKAFPKLGRKVPEFNIISIREIICQNYRIIYKTYEEYLEIVSIFHGSRLLKI